MHAACEGISRDHYKALNEVLSIAGDNFLSVIVSDEEALSCLSWGTESCLVSFLGYGSEEDLDVLFLTWHYAKIASCN